MIAAGDDEVQAGVDLVTSRAVNTRDGTGDAAKDSGKAKGRVNEVGA